MLINTIKQFTRKRRQGIRRSLHVRDTWGLIFDVSLGKQRLDLPFSVLAALCISEQQDKLSQSSIKAPLSLSVSLSVPLSL